MLNSFSEFVIYKKTLLNFNYEKFPLPYFGNCNVPFAIFRTKLTC